MSKIGTKPKPSQAAVVTEGEKAPRHKLSRAQAAEVAWKVLEAKRLIEAARELLVAAWIDMPLTDEVTEQVKGIYGALYADELTVRGGNSKFFDEQLADVAAQVLAEGRSE